MRLLRAITLLSLPLAFAVAGIAGAAVVTIDGSPVSDAIVQDGHLLVPFHVPMERLGATVAWSDLDQTGVASIDGRELVRTQVGSNTAYIEGHPAPLTVSPELVGQLEYVPVEMLPEISKAQLSIANDGQSAAITGFDLTGVYAVGTSRGDPHANVLLLVLWLLPIGGFVCAAGFIIVTAQINLDYARRGTPHQPS
jgi:hypothetical protein